MKVIYEATNTEKVIQTPFELMNKFGWTEIGRIEASQIAETLEAFLDAGIDIVFTQPIKHLPNHIGFWVKTECTVDAINIANELSR